MEQLPEIYMKMKQGHKIMYLLPEFFPPITRVMLVQTDIVMVRGKGLVGGRVRVKRVVVVVRAMVVKGAIVAPITLLLAVQLTVLQPALMI